MKGKLKAVVAPAPRDKVAAKASAARLNHPEFAYALELLGGQGAVAKGEAGAVTRVSGLKTERVKVGFVSVSLRSEFAYALELLGGQSVVAEGAARAVARVSGQVTGPELVRVDL